MCDLARRTIALVTAARIGIVAPWHAHAECGHEQVVVEGAPSEITDACTALRGIVEPITRPEQVNAMVHGIDPDAFGERAHRYTVANGNREFVRPLLKGEVEFSMGELSWTK